MNIIAKKQNQEVVDNGYYELFTTETVKDINGEDVIIPRSIGSFNLANLENDKANIEMNYQSQLKDINDKIEAINLVK